MKFTNNPLHHSTLCSVCPQLRRQALSPLVREARGDRSAVGLTPRLQLCHIWSNLSPIRNRVLPGYPLALSIFLELTPSEPEQAVRTSRCPAHPRRLLRSFAWIIVLFNSPAERSSSRVCQTNLPPGPVVVRRILASKVQANPQPNGVGAIVNEQGLALPAGGSLRRSTR